MPPINKRVLIFEAVKLGLLIVLVIGIFNGRINPILAGKLIGIGALAYGAHFFNRAFKQKDHSNVLLRLRGDDRRIPTTKSHRTMNLVFATSMILCGVALLFRL